MIELDIACYQSIKIIGIDMAGEAAKVRKLRSVSGIMSSITIEHVPFPVSRCDQTEQVALVWISEKERKRIQSR